MNDFRQRRLLLSGGIGAGKSEVALILTSRGVPVIHTDEIGHSVLEPEGEAYSAVSSRWPQVVVEGRIARDRLATIVFADPETLGELEAMTHPFIAAGVFAELERYSDDPLVVVEIPHLNDLLGRGWIRVVVAAPSEARFQRLLSRGMDPEDARARMAAQPSDSEWGEAADFVIDNSADVARLGEEVDRVLSILSESQ